MEARPLSTLHLLTFLVLHFVFHFPRIQSILSCALIISDHTSDSILFFLAFLLHHPSSTSPYHHPVCHLQTHATLLAPYRSITPPTSRPPLHLRRENTSRQKTDHSLLYSLRNVVFSHHLWPHLPLIQPHHRLLKSKLHTRRVHQVLHLENASS